MCASHMCTAVLEEERCGPRKYLVKTVKARTYVLIALYIYKKS